MTSQTAQKAMACTQESGTCTACRGACENKPGWFKPGEVERVAQFLGLTLPELFERHLLVDYWEADNELGQDVFVLSPAIEEADPGQEFPRNPRGRCVFYQDERCSIHPVKPFKCRTYWCGYQGNRTYHLETAKAWVDSQAQVANLLGREPEKQGEWSIFDDLGIGGWSE